MDGEPLSRPRSLAATTSRFLIRRSDFHRFDIIANIITISFLIWVFKLRFISPPILTISSLDYRVGLHFSPEYLADESGNESNKPSTTQGRRGRRTGVDGCLFTICLQLK